jgi:hypothetical protein
MLFMNAQASLNQKPAVWRYGFLALLIVSVVCNLALLPGSLRSHHGLPFYGLVVSIALLLNHLAFFCLRPGRVRNALVGMAIAFLAGGLTYVLTVFQEFD